MKENTIIINGKLMTMDEKGTADWMVIERNRILEVGRWCGTDAQA